MSEEQRLSRAPDTIGKRAERKETISFEYSPFVNPDGPVDRAVYYRQDVMRPRAGIIRRLSGSIGFAVGFRVGDNRDTGAADDVHAWRIE